MVVLKVCFMKGLLAKNIEVDKEIMKVEDEESKT